MRTFASRAVFSPPYTPPEKMIGIFFASADANSARLRDVTEFFGRPAAEARPRVRAETRLYDVTNAAGREKARVHCTRADFREGRKSDLT